MAFPHRRNIEGRVCKGEIAAESRTHTDTHMHVHTQDNTRVKLSSSISATLLHLHPADRLHICWLAPKNIHGGEMLTGFDVFVVVVFRFAKLLKLANQDAVWDTHPLTPVSLTEGQRKQTLLPKSVIYLFRESSVPADFVPWSKMFPFT